MRTSSLENTFEPLTYGSRGYPLLATGLLSLLQGALPTFGGQDLEPYRLQAEDYVELEAQVQVLQWAQPHPDYSYKARIVVGRDTWMMELDDGMRTCAWFTGTNLVEERVMEPTSPGGIDMGRATRQIEPSADGNPTRRERVIDRLDLAGRIVWMAFCSGPCLNHGLSEVYPPDDLWKEYLDRSTFTRKVTAFEDDLGLPERFLIFANENQPVLDYRVLSTTNVLHWDLPLEFALAQYRPTGTKGWMLDFIARGRIENARPSNRPSLKIPGVEQVATTPVQESERGVRYELGEGSSVRIEGTSDVHDWELQSSRVYGYLQLNAGWPAGDQVEQGVEFEARGAVVVPVRHLTTGFGGPMFGGKRDSALLHQMLKTSRYPNIECELRGIDFERGTEKALGEKRACKLRVFITAGGVSREMEVTGEITREKAGLLRVSGSGPLRMSDFGVIAPSVQGKDFIVKVGDELKVGFELVFKRK